MVLASTGQRPAQLKRAQPADVHLERDPPVLVRPPGQGRSAHRGRAHKGHGERLARVHRRRRVGRFDGSDYAKRLYAAGWPRNIRPYNAKHTLAITLGEAGVEFEDIKDFFGHKDVKTTRIYTGYLMARMSRLAHLLEGRLGWTADDILPAAASAGLVTETGNRQGRDGSRLVKNRRNLTIVKPGQNP